jgi:hypothetical protein
LRENKVKALRNLYGLTKIRDFLSWWIDLSLCFIVAQFISNIEGFYVIENTLIEYLSLLIGGLFYLWLISIILNFPILLMSGLSYGELITGFRTREKYRVGSVLSLSRYSVKFFTGPCPRLMEKLFKDSIPLLVKPLTKQLNILVLLITLFVSLTAPMVRSLRYGGPLNQIVKSFDQKVISEMEVESRLSSQRLHLVTKLGESFNLKWNLFPRFDLIKVDGRSRISSYLQIQDLKTFETGQLERSRKLNFSKLLLSEFKSHSHLKRSNENLVSDSKNTSKSIWSAAGKEELKDLLSRSLTFGASIKGSIVNQFSNGPFVSGYYSLRSEIKKVVPLTTINSFSFVKLGRHHFILFSGTSHNSNRFAFFSLEEKLPYIYSFSWQGSEAIMDNFIESFFKRVSWEFSDDTNFWSYPSIPSDITVTHLMDMLIEKELSKEHQNSLEVSIYMYYFSLYKKALLENNTKMINVLISEVKKTDRVINLKKKKMTPVFIARWNSLVTNTVSHNKKYFGVKK